MGTGIPVPATIPEGSKAFTLCVPDDPFFFSVVMGVLKLTTFKYYWDGTDDQKTAVTDRMLIMYYDYQEQTGCMDCEQVTDCIEDDEGTQAALAARTAYDIQNNSSVQQAITQYISENSTSGSQMPESISAGSMTPPGTFETDDECDEDKVGTGCQYLSEYIDGMVSDFFELLASQTEAAKIAAKAAGAIPVLGDYVQSAAEFAIALQEKIAVTYAGAQSEEVILSIACDFKCRADLTCSLSIDDAIDVIVTRLGTITPDEFGTIIDLLITGTFTGVQIVETGYLVALAAIKFGQSFGPYVGIRPIGQIMAIGAADSNNGWEEWCPDCPGEEFDIAVNANNAYGQDSGHTVTPGDVWVFDVPGTWNAGIGTCDANGNPGTADPSFWLPSANAGALVGKWDSETDWFLIGTGGTFTVPVGAAALTLICNDVAGYPPVYGDNSGTLTAHVALNP